MATLVWWQGEQDEAEDGSTLGMIRCEARPFSLVPVHFVHNCSISLKTCMKMTAPTSSHSSASLEYTSLSGFGAGALAPDPLGSGRRPNLHHSPGQGTISDSSSRAACRLEAGAGGGGCWQPHALRPRHQQPPAVPGRLPDAGRWAAVSRCCPRGAGALHVRHACS